MLLEAILVAAAALYVCPGDVYTDHPREGCQPMQSSSNEGFSRVPEAPKFDSKFPAPAAPDAGGRAVPRYSVFLLHQLRNVRCTKNGSSCPPSRAALELALSQRESSNGGRI